LTGHREPHNQTAFACTAPGAGQHRDSAEGAGGVVGYLGTPATCPRFF